MKAFVLPAVPPVSGKVKLFLPIWVGIGKADAISSKEGSSGRVRYKWSYPKTTQVMNKTAYVSLIPGEEQIWECGAYADA